MWIIIGGLAVGGIRSTGICSRSVNFGACSADCGSSRLFSFDFFKDGIFCPLSIVVAVMGFLSAILCKSPVPTLQKKRHQSCRIDLFFPSWNVKVMCCSVLLFYSDPSLLSCCCCGVSTLQNGRNTGLTAVRNIGVSTLEDGRDTGLTAVRNIGVSALEDGRDTRLPAVGNDGVSTMEDGTDAELTAVGNNGVSTLGDGRETELTSVACLPWRMVQIPSSRR